MILDAVESYLGGHPILLKALHDSEKVPPSRSGDLIKKTSHRELQQLQLKIKHEVKRNTKQYLFVFSAHDHATLLRNISAVSKDARTCDAFDLAYTLGVKRSRFLYGAFGISNKSAAPEQLQESKMTFGIKASSEPVLAFAFSGKSTVVAYECQQDI